MKHSESIHRGGFTVWELVVVVLVLLLLAVLLLNMVPRGRNGRQEITCINNLKQIGMAVRLWSGDNGDRSPDQVPVGEGGLANTNATKVPAWLAFQFFQVMSNELNTPKLVICPQDQARLAAGAGAYSFHPNRPGARFDNLAVSYFVGGGAKEDYPQMLLSGDRNIYGPTTTPDSNDGYGNSPTNGSGARVVFGSKPSRVGWTSRIHRTVGNVALANGSVQQLSSSGLIQALNNSGDTNTVPGANVILFP